MRRRGARAAPPAVAGAGPGANADAHPGLQLAASLLLICLFFLPLAGGGYSGAGYQLGFVLLPLAAGLALWLDWRLVTRGHLMGVLPYFLTGIFAAVTRQPGWVLWYYLLHLLCVWLLARAVWRNVPSHGALILPVASAGALLTALYGWFLWYGAGRLDYSITSTFGLHNAYGGFLLLAWPLAAITALEQPNPRARLGWGAAALFLAVTLVLTYSKASLACLVLQVLLVGLVAGQRRAPAAGLRSRAWLWGALLAAAGLLALPTVRQALSMMLDFNSYSMQGRLRFWQAAMEMFRDRPWSGVGLGSFGVAYPQYQQDWLFYSSDPHSWILQLAAELGLLGVIFGFGVLAGVVVWLGRLYHAGQAGVPDLRIRLWLAAAAVLGSLAHVAFDFDYTFGATVALLGLALAYGSRQTESAPAPSSEQPALATAGGGEAAARPAARLWERLEPLRGRYLAVLLLCAALFGETYTLERFTLDRLRDGALSGERQESLLRSAIRTVPGNYKTHYQLASLLAQQRGPEGREEASRELLHTVCLESRYAPAWALKGLLAQPPQAGEADLARAIELDPYNYPEHYVYWSRSAADDQERLRRLELGMQRIGVTGPVEPDHPRPQWFALNPLFATWYEQMAKLTPAERERELYERRARAIREYLEELRKGTP